MDIIPNGTVFREYNGITNEFLTRGMHYLLELKINCIHIK
jgi:hypothetical protein